MTALTKKINSDMEEKAQIALTAIAMTINRHFASSTSPWPRKFVESLPDRNKNHIAILIDELGKKLTKNEVKKFTDIDEINKSMKELELLRYKEIQVVNISDEEYPEPLLHCPNAPLVLYIKSKTPAKELFKDFHGISIVGTRDMSHYGQSSLMGYFTDNEELRKKTVVSGLAYGVDQLAHRLALDSGIKTIAVLPTGVDEIYPAQHERLAEEIANTPGCALITHYPMETKPIALNFLRRNCTIAGLSDETLVIESKDKGGAMLTARLAYDLGRKVYAVPGRIYDIRSNGCNKLIKEGIAELYTY